MRSSAARSEDELFGREALLGLGGGLGTGIVLDQLLEGASRAGIVAKLGVTARDVKQRVRNFLAVGIRRDHLSLRPDRGSVIPERVLRVARPIQGGRREGALG